LNVSGLNTNVSGVAVLGARPCLDLACFYFSCNAGDGDVAACGGAGTGVESASGNVALSF